MTESIYKEYQNKYYNPNDNDKKPGDNDNWKSIQKGFHDIGTTQLETSAGLTLGKGTEDETSLTAGELKEIKDPTQLETSGGLTLGKGTEDETSLTAVELEAMKSGGDKQTVIKTESYTFSTARTYEGVNILDNVSYDVHGLKPNTTYNLTLVNLWLIIQGAKAPALRSPTLSISNKTSDNDGNILNVALSSIMISDTAVTAGQLIAMFYAEEV